MRKSLKEILAEQESNKGEEEEMSDQEIDIHRENQTERAINELKKNKSSFVLLFIEDDHKTGGAIGCLNKEDARAMQGNIIEAAIRVMGGPNEQ